MKVVKLINEDLDKELSVNVFSSWNEVSLNTYFKLAELENKKNKEDEFDIDYVLSVINLISDVDKTELVHFSLNELVKIINTMSEMGQINSEMKEFIIIDSTIYVPKKNMQNITTSEAIYIKQMQKTSRTDKDISLSILSILLRPGYKKDVNGVEKYIQYPLDEEGIEQRKELFLNKLSINETLPILNFFTSGMQK